MAFNTVPRNGSPMAVFYGADDRSIPPLVLTPVQKSIHLPLSFTFSSRGDHENAYVVAGDNLFSMYGRDVLNYDSKYTTINTPFMKMFNELANPQMVQRLVADDAEWATLRIYAEVFTGKVPTYERLPNGEYKYDATGKKIKTGEVSGLNVIWRVAPFTADAPIRQGKTFAGTKTNIDGTKSTIYPIIDMPASFIGAGGSDFGFQLSCPNAKSAVRVDPSVSQAMGARVYHIQFNERLTENDSGTPVKTRNGATFVPVAFKKGAYYQPLRQHYDFRRNLIKSYRNMNPAPGMVPDLGPVKDFYVYDSNLETVLTAAAAVAGTEYVAEPYMVDIFSGLDVYGNPYNGLVVDNGTEGGELFTESHTHYLKDGSDGTMNNAVFDELVQREMLAFGVGKVNYLNMQKYPCSFIWDAGYTTDTKEALCNFMGRRPDTITVLSTHVYDEGANNQATEDSMKVALAAMLRAFPESIRYGTPAMRGAVVGHSMLLNDESYGERVPLTYSLAKFMARYAGSQIGKFRSEFRFDRGELAIIEDGYDINLPYKTGEAYEGDWDAGLINIRSFDQYRYMFSAARTIYPYSSSVLVGLLPATVIGDLERVCGDVWAETAGSQSLTEGQLEKLVTDKINTKIIGKYDNVTNPVPRAFHTEEDRSNGNTISVEVTVPASPTHTINKYTIIATRRGAE